MGAMLEEDEKNDIYRDYVALTQTNIARLLAAYLGAEYKMPDYMGLMYPDNKTGEPTTQDVIDHILGKLDEVKDGRIHSGGETDAERHGISDEVKTG